MPNLKITIPIDPKKQAKREREERIKKNKENQKSNLSNKDLFEYLNDTNSRLEEIYDIIKELKK